MNVTDLYIGLINGMVNSATLIKALSKEIRDFQKSEDKLKLD